MTQRSKRQAAVAAALMVGAAALPSAGEGARAQATGPATVGPAAPVRPPPEMRASKRSLASFAKGQTQECYDRATEPYTALVDAHFHPRPFGGQAIPPAALYEFFDKAGVRFVNYFGIGQSLDMRSACTYYLDCPGTTALPSIKNDFVNGQEAKVFPHPNLNIVLSMTFIDLAHPEAAVETIKLYDKEFPGMFRWAGEVNVVKQALAANGAEYSTLESIDRWAPFMKVLEERGIPITLHSDLGNDAEPTKYVYLMEHVLKTYPRNKIVWAHMGLSKELTKMNPRQHIAIMKRALDADPNLTLDISWDVIYNAYHEYGQEFVDFFNLYPTRILNGSDFVAAGNKSYDQYAKELEVTSRVNRVLSDEAFRRIALGQNYFELMKLDFEAPPVCGAQRRN